MESHKKSLKKTEILFTRPLYVVLPLYTVSAPQNREYDGHHQGRSKAQLDVVAECQRSRKHAHSAAMNVTQCEGLCAAVRPARWSEGE